MASRYVSTLTGSQMDDALNQMNNRIPEGWAVGQKDGVDVPSTSPFYHNNAKYYAQNASSSATAASSASSTASTNATQAGTYATNASNSATAAANSAQAAEDAADRAEAIVGGQFVSYGQSQALSDTQKAQARTNIGITTFPSPATATPLMDGTAAVGTSDLYARQDHRHPTDTSRAASTHNHAASDINSGTLGVARGGTGAASFTANSVVMSGSSTTAALTTRSVTNNTSSTAVPANTNIPTCNTVKYGLDNRINRTTAVNAADTNYTTYMARGETLNSADTNPTVNGTIAWTYE